jgi:hypothetical protein
VIYFAEPTIPDVQTPLNFTSTTFTWCSPWNGRHVIIDHASVDPATMMPGKLVVTSVFGTAYVVADTGALYDPVKDMGGFNHMYVFSFGRPDSSIDKGRVIDTFSGNVSKFVGFTELNFPLQTVNPAAPVAALPPVLDLTGADEDVSLKLLRNAAATVRITGTVCPIDTTSDNWNKYHQFNMDIGGKSMCGYGAFGVSLPAKTYGDFNPLDAAQKMKSVTITGMLQNNSGQNPVCKGTAGPQVIPCRTVQDCNDAAAAQSDMTCAGNLKKPSVTCIEGNCLRGNFNFWSVVPRDPSDIVVH